MYQQAIMEEIAGINRIEARIEHLRNKGYTVAEYPMGSGGVGQYKQMADGSVRIQIGYGHGRYNYAYCVVLEG